MSQGTRPQRVADAIRHELSRLLQRDVRDPGVAPVVVTYVRMSRDLQQARVFYVGPDGPDERRDAARALRRAKPFLRREIGQRVRLRRVPELRFEYDDSAETQDRMARLFDEIAKTRPVTAPPDEEP